MYEGETYAVILQRMLARISDTLDKREGAIIFDAEAPTAMELANAYIELDRVLTETFGDTASRAYLIRRCAERGMVPDPATGAVRKGVFTPAGVERLGDRFNGDALNYVVTQKGVQAAVTCTAAGGTASAGDVTVTLDGVGYTATLEVTDNTAELVAEKLRALTPGGWSVSGTGNTAVFTAAACGARTGSYEDTDNTGVNVAVSVTTAGCDSQLTCETQGQAGNVYAGRLTPIGYVPGLTSAFLTDILVPGEDAEDTEALRQRYLASFRSQAYGGNVADYLEKVHALEGVGGVKVTPVWDGGGTVRVAFIAADFSAPSATLIAWVQNALDPVGHGGEGLGVAPIGHVVTVVGAQNVSVNVVCSLTYQTGWDWGSAAAGIKTAVDAYFVELAEDWENQTGLVVRISQLESRILNCPGVLDVTGTTLNGSAANLSLEEEKIPVRGTVNGE